ncbi:rab-GTPase-TBC domain-containing protein [Lipomyces kononenkoae]|uniref:Rab-GTPase-TBC domain-containing protein n=1 Tax=Lipomyces kononenkoae TaxID=34357 RepID=A0ACC3SY91_LIPKO
MTTTDVRMQSQRTLEETRALWKKLLGGSFQSLTALKSSVINGSSICDNSLRSVCWKMFMLLPDLQPDTWGNILHTERQKYSELKKQYLALHLKRAQENAGIPSEEEHEDLSVVNPLSQDISNPWNTFWKDEDLRKDILQDIERTFPDIDYFRDQKVQRMMLDILFVYTKMHPVVSYQQGMHELLAPIFWVISNDALEVPAEISESDKLMYDSLSADYIEHDSFTIFNFIMQNAWEWYAAEGKVKGPSENGRVTPPIVVKARTIQEYYLRNIDPELERHLRVLGVEPQLWGIRWIRLLFGREFDFARLLNLWDCLFAADAQSLDLVDFVCVALLLRIRDQLLLADYTGALTLLLRYPVTEAMAPSTFIEDAIYLQVHVTPEGGHRIIQQYIPYDDELDSQQPLHMVNGMLVPSTKNLYLQRRAMMEKTVSGIAKNVFETSERIGVGVNKYVRERVQDVRIRAANAIQNGAGTVQYLTPETAGIGSMPRPRLQQRNSRTRVGSLGRNGMVASSAFDEAEYNRERNERLAEVLSTSLGSLTALLDDTEDKSRFTEALDRIELVRKCLLFDNLHFDRKYTTPIAVNSPKTSISDESIPSPSLPVPRPSTKSQEEYPLDSTWVNSVESDINGITLLNKISSSLETSKISSSLDTQASVLFDSPPVSSSVESSNTGSSFGAKQSLFDSDLLANGQHSSSILSPGTSPSTTNLFGPIGRTSTSKPTSRPLPASSSTSPALAPISIEEAKMLLGI